MAFANFINSLVLQCSFLTFEFEDKLSYTCTGRNVHTFSNDRTVTGISGNHLVNKSNEDVEQLVIFNETCPFLPRNIGSFFKNLETFSVVHSNVFHLFPGDLDGFTNLRTFNVSHNPIEKLTADFFKGLPSIEVISFMDCHLKFIDPKALDLLVNLQTAYFSSNICIDFADEDYIEDVKTKITENCSTYNDSDFNPEDYDEIFEMIEDEAESSSSWNVLIIISAVFVLIIVSGILLYLLKRKRGEVRDDCIELNENVDED
jgi:hypothetical protein